MTRGSRPLGAFETALSLSDDHSPLNVVAALHLEAPPPEADLREALADLQRTQPECRTRLVRQRGGFRFLQEDVPGIPLRVLPRRDDEHWLEIAEAEANQRIEAARGPLLRFTYLAPPTSSENGDLILTSHHSLLDGDSGQALVERLLRRWAGAPLPGTSAPGLPEPADRFFPPSARGARGALGAAAFMARQMMDELLHRVSPGRRAEPSIRPGARTHLSRFRLSAETTGELAVAARRRRLTLNSVLSAAVLLAVWRRRYGGRPRRLRGITFPNLRPYLKPAVAADAPGCYFSLMRYSELLGKDDDTWSVAERLQERLGGAFRRGEKFTAAAMAPLAMRMSISGRAGRMAAAALSYVGPLRLARVYGGTRLAGLQAFISTPDIGPEYSGLVFLWDDRLEFNVMTLEGEMSDDEVGAIGQDVVARLEAALASPSRGQRRGRGAG